MILARGYILVCRVLVKDGGREVGSGGGSHSRRRAWTHRHRRRRSPPCRSTRSSTATSWAPPTPRTSCWPLARARRNRTSNGWPWPRRSLRWAGPGRRPRCCCWSRITRAGSRPGSTPRSSRPTPRPMARRRWNGPYAPSPPPASSPPTSAPSWSPTTTAITWIPASSTSYPTRGSSPRQEQPCPVPTPSTRTTSQAWSPTSTLPDTGARTAPTSSISPIWTSPSASPATSP